VSHLDAWMHCPVCAGPLSAGEHGERRCAACGFTAYDNPAPTASGLIARDGLLMVTRRAHEPFAGWWDLPGGFMEPLETPEQAVRRELLEETGLTVDVGELIGVFPDRYGEHAVATINLFHRATVVSGEERPADDITEIAWMRPDQIDPAQLAFECCREALVTFVRKS
jgi:8-oxo-dGTP diphosphatase